MTYEYGVVIRRQRKDAPPVWQFWIGPGCVREATSFLAVMNWAGGRGYEAFAAGNFDELGVPEVLVKRAVAGPPPPPLPKATGEVGAELGAPSVGPKRPRKRRTPSKPGPASGPKSAR